MSDDLTRAAGEPPATTTPHDDVDVPEPHADPVPPDPAEDADEPTDEVADEPTDEVADEPTDEAADEPTDEAAPPDPAEDADEPDEPAEPDEDTDEPADEDTDEPADEDTDEPADEDTDEAAPPDPAEDADDDPVPDEVAPAEGAAVAPDPADEARRRLLHALKPRATKSQFLAALVCAVLGFAVVVTTRQANVQTLASLRESELVAVLDNVTQQSARLEDQARTLQQTLDGLRTASDRGPAARQAAQERLEVLGVLAGTLPATGPGIELEIPDPKLAVNATEMLETVQELRDAGAEAMQIGPARVVANTALTDTGAGLLVDDTVVAPPYRVHAIGDPQTLAAALEIPGGVLEVLRGKGIVAVVRPQDSITITALRMPRTPQYARPATS